MPSPEIAEQNKEIAELSKLTGIKHNTGTGQGNEVLYVDFEKPERIGFIEFGFDLKTGAFGGAVIYYSEDKALVIEDMPEGASTKEKARWIKDKVNEWTSQYFEGLKSSSQLRKLARSIIGYRIKDLPDNAFEGHYIGYKGEDFINFDDTYQLGLGHPAFGGEHEEDWTVSEELEEIGADTTKLNAIWEKHLGKLHDAFIKDSLYDGTTYQVVPNFDVSGFDYASQDGGYWVANISVDFDAKPNLESTDIDQITHHLDDVGSRLVSRMKDLATELNREFDRLGVEFRSEVWS